MSSIVDNSTALEVMKSANADCVELILKLKALLNGKEPVTFNMGKYSITVNSILELINSYKNGQFDEILLGGQTTGKQVKLSVDSDGNLCVTDVDGNVVSVSCSKLVSSNLENCVAKKVTAESARILSIKGMTSVTGGNVSFGSMNFDSLNANNLKSKNVHVENLTVNGSLASEGLTVMGIRQFSPRSIHSVFYRNGAPIDRAADLLVIGGTSPSWEWNIARSGAFNPSDVGFPLVNGTQQVTQAMRVPDMIQFMGNTEYGDFRYRPSFISRYTTMPAPANLMVYVTLPGSSYPQLVTDISDRDGCAFAALLAFPTGGYTTAGGDNGTWYLTGFSQTDLGKEVYYRTLDKEWWVYRTMTVTCREDRTVPSSVVFGSMTRIPAYSCVRFIVNCIDKTETSGMSTTRKVIYALEFA